MTQKVKREFPTYETLVQQRSCMCCPDYHYDREHSSSWDSCPCSDCRGTKAKPNFSPSKGIYDLHKEDFYSPWGAGW